MPSLHLRNLSFAHLTGVPVLEGVDLDVATDPAPTRWFGIVGPNGSGKSTLLRIASGELTPVSGTVDVSCSVPAVLVPQDVDDLTDAVVSFAWEWDGHAQRLRSRLGLDPDHLIDGNDGWLRLSPGQRKRWQVAAALHARPDVLLLDEPTNHLDGQARDLLIDTLQTHVGLGLVVSHDRDLLDALTEQTLFVVGGDVVTYAGAYSQARRQREQDTARAQQEHTKAVKEERRMRRVLAEVRRDRHSAEVAPRRQRRINPNDSAIRATGLKMAQQKAEKAIAARVHAVNSRVERASASASDASVRRDLGGDVTFDHAATGRPVLAALTGDVQHRGGEMVLHDVDVDVARDDRIHIDGANGAGKTSLLSALVADMQVRSTDVVVLPQELRGGREELAALHGLPLDQRGRVLGIVALLGVDPEALLVTDQPSPGQLRKLVLAQGLATAASALVLDEPTNHLDLPSIERLQEALDGWPGALVLVTHDRRLADAVTTTRWLVADGRVQVEPSM